MPKANNSQTVPMTVKCPMCGQDRPLQVHPTKPGRLVAVCACIGWQREIYETDTLPDVPETQTQEVSND